MTLKNKIFPNKLCINCKFKRKNVNAHVFSKGTSIFNDIVKNNPVIQGSYWKIYNQ